MSQSSLLLLPHPPPEVSFESLKLAYGASLTQVLTELSKVSSANPDTQENDVSLNVAVVYGRSSYSGLQQFFGLMYRLACGIATDNSIDVQFGNDVDLRFMLIDHTNGSQQDDNISKPSGNLISLNDLAGRKRVSNRVYSVQSENGERLLRDFLSLQKTSLPNPAQEYAITRVPGGDTIQTDKDQVRPSPAGRWSYHHSVAVGGTFDHLHAGHKLLLTMTSLLLDPMTRPEPMEDTCLTIGITGDDLLKKKKYAEELQAWEDRQHFVRKFLLEFLSFLAPKNIFETTATIMNPEERGREVIDTLQSGLRIRYKEIFDPFGPTITDPRITALVVSSETRAGGKAVNDKRTDKGWQPLEVFEVDVVDINDDDKGVKDGFESKISSTEIRARILRRKASANAKG